MITVKQILEEKGHDAWTIEPDAKVFDALKLMAEKGIGALVKAVMSVQKVTIQQLENYIMGKYQ
jgi:CBS domain-containing protein